jgi:Xaa-Pro aminopeptidase
VWVLEDKYSGQSTMSKYKDVADKIGKDADMMIISTLDDIAWVLNLRGNDIEFNPLFFSYLIYKKDEAGSFKCDLFLDKSKVSEPDVAAYLAANNVSVYEYAEYEAKIKEYAQGD